MRCLVHGPAAKLEDEARFLGDRNELGRTDLAAILMGPAGKRLETGDLSRLEVDQRLIEEFQLVLVERAAKLGLDRKAAARLGRLFRLIDLRPPRGFRLLDCELGIAEQLFGILARMHQRNPDRAFDLDLQLGQLERRRHDLLNPLRGVESIFHAAA